MPLSRSPPTSSPGALAKLAAPVIVRGCRPVDVARRETAAVADVDLIAGQARLGLPIPAPLARRLLASPQGLFVRQRFRGQKWNLFYSTRFRPAIGSSSGSRLPHQRSGDRDDRCLPRSTTPTLVVQSQARATASTPRAPDLRARCSCWTQRRWSPKSAMRHFAGIANVPGVERLLLVGDCQQIQSIDTEEAYSLIQSNGIALARIEKNLCQFTDQPRTVAAIINEAGRRQLEPRRSERRPSLAMATWGTSRRLMVMPRPRRLPHRRQRSRSSRQRSNLRKSRLEGTYSRARATMAITPVKAGSGQPGSAVPICPPPTEIGTARCTACCRTNHIDSQEGAGSMNMMNWSPVDCSYCRMPLFVRWPRGMPVHWCRKCGRPLVRYPAPRAPMPYRVTVGLHPVRPETTRRHPTRAYNEGHRNQ